uniref:Uncharacterized protein n=1 Tax=Anguilla anguilla TaxID=7936 RepID=A0A0E9RQY3_ANGAN
MALQGDYCEKIRWYFSLVRKFTHHVSLSQDRGFLCAFIFNLALQHIQCVPCQLIAN